jgi:hypothetical protein
VADDIDRILVGLRRISEDTHCDCWMCEVAASAHTIIERLLAETNQLRLQIVALSIPKGTENG